MRLSDPRWLERFHRDPKLIWAVLLGVLLVYSAAFVIFYPSVITNDDEATYLDQTRILVEGHTTLPKLDPVSGESKPYRTDYYPPGTALLMAPFVACSGWRGAYLAPLLGLLCGVLLMARWLQDEERSPLFALLVLAFPATLVMARVGMSDVPSLAVVILGLWLFWRGIDRGASWWLASGFVAGASMLFRDTNAVVFAPIFAGSVLRREPKSLALVAGGLVGLGLKLVLAHLLLGDPLYSRSSYVPEPLTMGGRLGVYLLGLVVFVPGGLLFALAYRGRRWPELRAGVVLFVLFFAIQKHATFASDLSRRLILDWRYMIPIVPLVVFGMAESLPRLWRRVVGVFDSGARARLEGIARAVMAAGILTIAGASVAVHYAFDRFSATQVTIRDTIHAHTGDDSILVTNMLSTRKFLRNLERPYLFLDRDDVDAAGAADLADRYGAIYVVLLDRTETAHRQEDARRNAAFVESLHPAPIAELDQQVSATERLRIWRVLASEAAAQREQTPPNGASSRTSL